MNFKKNPIENIYFFWSKNIFDKIYIFDFENFENFDDFFEKVDFSKINFFKKIIKIFDFSTFFIFLKLFFDQIKYIFSMDFLKVHLWFRRIDWKRFQSVSDNLHSPICASRKTFGVLSDNSKAIPALPYWRPGFSGNLPIFCFFVSPMLILRASEWLIADSVFLDQRYRMRRQRFWR